MSNLVPVINASVDAECGKFDRCLTNFVVRAGVFVKDSDREVVTDVLDVDIEGLVPDWRLASSVLDSRLEILLASRNFTIGVHLAEGLRVTSQSRLDHCQGERSRSSHSVNKFGQFITNNSF